MQRIWNNLSTWLHMYMERFGKEKRNQQREKI